MRGGGDEAVAAWMRGYMAEQGARVAITPALLAVAALVHFSEAPGDNARLEHMLGLARVALSRGKRAGARRRAAAELAPAAPARPRGRPAGTGYFDLNPAVADAVMVTLARRRISARNMMGLLRATFADAEMPSRKTLQRFMTDYEERDQVFLASRRDPDLFKSRYRPALGRADASVTHAHEVWEIDTTKVDVHCTDGRKCIIGIIDRWSRRARYQIVESESGQSVRRMLIDTIIAWGVMPERLKVDNGSGYVNASVTSACETLGIVLDPCLPGHPEDKPFVERLFGTFMRERASLLPGFAGHNVAQAQALRAAAKKKTGRAVIEPKVHSAALQEVINGWIDGEYHLRVHSTLGMSPMEKWQRSPVEATAAPGEDVLRLALSAFVRTGTVTKRGVVWKGGRYWAAPLAPLVGRQISIRRDEEDLGALFIFDEDGAYICTAINHHRAGVPEQAFAMAAKADMDRHVAERNAVLAAAKRHYSVDKAIDGLLRAEAEAAGKIVHLAPRTARRDTAAMRSMADAPSPALPVPAMSREEIAAAMAAPPAAPASIHPAAGMAREAEALARTDAVLAAAGRGEPVDPAELARAEAHRRSGAYRAHKAMHESFGAALTPRRIPAGGAG